MPLSQDVVLYSLYPILFHDYLLSSLGFKILFYKNPLTIFTQPKKESHNGILIRVPQYKPELKSFSFLTILAPQSHQIVSEDISSIINFLLLENCQIYGGIYKNI
jgi:hypothetical protein